MLRSNASVPIAPAPLRFGPMFPPCPWIKWQVKQTAATCLPCVVSPRFSASVRNFESFSACVRASDAVSTGGGSSVRAMRAVPLSLPHEAPPVAVVACPKWRADRIRELLTTRPVHAIAFAHPSRVRRLMSVLDGEEHQALRALVLAASNPSTARAVREHGLEPAVVASGPAALAEALVAASTKRMAPDG